MAFRLLALLGLLLGLAIPAHAQDISSADRAAIRDIIQSQVEAFRRDDGDAAFGYASPSIRGLFGTSEIFMDMVRQGYQPVYRPRVFDFREIVTLHGQVTQKVHVIGPDGRPFAKGLVRYSSVALAELAGSRTSDLPEGAPHEVIHRDDLVVLP